MKRLLATAGFGGSVVSALVSNGWLVAVLAIAAIVAVVLAVCWILNDESRSRRFERLLDAWRGGTNRPEAPSRSRRRWWYGQRNTERDEEAGQRWSGGGRSPGKSTVPAGKRAGRQSAADR